MSFNFTRSVTSAIVGISGYSAGYRGDDHELGKLDIAVGTEIDDDVVRARVTFGLRDWSGSWDDDYEGTINIVVVAELADPALPPPRGDLVITGVETSQAIQYFRSFDHLDGVNARPDNSIPIISRKGTGVRVYVDYDSSLGLPPISQLSGELEVIAASGANFTVLPKASITPRRDNEINRGASDHTVNFEIPEAWCQGQVTIKCTVFDVADPLARSGVFQRTLIFRNSEPLRVYGIGVHYTGQGMDLAAPSQSGIVSLMAFTEKTYPIPEVLITGFTELDFSDDLKADIKDGCGDGFGSLLDDLEDLRGESSDIYYALLPSGVDTGSVGGCGRSGVGAGMAGRGTTAAHEIGHAFGRKHAPCGGACSTEPKNPDNDYPQYGSYQRDSIGAFGYDPALDRVKNPAAFSDFMGYSGSRWVSPYTYASLLSRFPSSSGISTPAKKTSYAMLRAAGTVADQDDNEALFRRNSTLFLRVNIDQGRNVTRTPSFHYDAWPRPQHGQRSRFIVHLLDGEGRTLSCQPMLDCCYHCEVDCWPKNLCIEMPFPTGAATLAIYEGDDKFYEEPIPDPPVVKLAYGFEDGRFVLRWDYADPEPGSGEGRPDSEGVWFLVQWLDDGEVWRGLIPRTQEISAEVPLRLLGSSKTLRVRVLASSGIATGVAEVELEQPREQNPPTLDIVVIAEITDGIVSLLPNGNLNVTVVDELGRTVGDPNILWFDEEGLEIGRGRALPVSALKQGSQVIRSVSLDCGWGACDKQWLVEWARDGVVGVRPGVVESKVVVPKIGQRRQQQGRRPRRTT